MVAPRKAGAGARLARHSRREDENGANISRHISCVLRGLQLGFFYSFNVLAQGREAGLPAKRPSGAAG